MAASVNLCIFIGNLGRDPESRYGADGSAIVNISIACSETWKDKSSGERKESTEWVRLVFFGKLAEIAGQYLKKGSQIYVEGRLKTRKWQDKDGKDQYTTEVVVETMKMLGGKPEGGQSEPSRPQNNGGNGSATPPRNAQGGQRNSFDDMDDDIPFANPYRGKLALIV